MSDDTEFLPGVPGSRVWAAHDAARAAIAAVPNPHGEPREARVRPDSPRASATLVANALGWFLERPGALPPWPGMEDATAPGTLRTVRIEAPLRLPFAGGGAWLDALLAGDGALIGVASARGEAFRERETPRWPRPFTRDSSWGERMDGWRALRDGTAGTFAQLDAVRLATAALALRTAGQGGREHAEKPAALFYLWADPRGTAPAARDAHAAERERLAALTAGDEVPLRLLPWSALAACWAASDDPAVAAHAEALREEFRL